MKHVEFSEELRREYERLFDTCEIRAERVAAAGQIVDRIVAGRDRYVAVGGTLGIPWYFVGLVHAMECGCDFRRHLHNGDPLTARTVRHPPGRPRTGTPPFTWEASAVDALAGAGLERWTDWSRAGVLYQLERYNGFGYRICHPTVATPYLWSFSAHYTSGKYVADRQWSATAVSQQCGAGVLLRAMWERGVLRDVAVEGTGVRTAAPPAPAPAAVPLIGYRNDGTEVPGVRELQAALARILLEPLEVDGKPGPLTSDALRRVTGHYLIGDPRASRDGT